MTTTTPSPALQLLTLVWQHCQEATSHSWLKLNHAMLAALQLAIEAGMRFDTADFDVIFDRFRGGYWCGLELVYSTAVLYRNSSAYLDIEREMGRKPFIVKGASITADTGDGRSGEGLARLIIGAGFRWKGEQVTVTSFNDKRGNVTACSYSFGGTESCSECGRVTKWSERKLLHRYTITHADIKQARKAAK